MNNCVYDVTTTCQSYTHVFGQPLQQAEGIQEHGWLAAPPCTANGRPCQLHVHRYDGTCVCTSMLYAYTTEMPPASQTPFSGQPLHGIMRGMARWKALMERVSALPKRPFAALVCAHQAPRKLALGSSAGQQASKGQQARGRGWSMGASKGAEAGAWDGHRLTPC